MKIGYARVSTTEQNPQLQTDALTAMGAERIFTDHGVSGSKASRPQLDAMLDTLREGDEVIVWKLDRLGRNTRHLLELVEDLRVRGVTFRSITEGLTSEGAMGRAMLTMMAAFAQLERELMQERTRAGLAVAAQNNRRGGRPRSVTDAQLQKARKLRAEGVSVDDVAKVIGVGRTTAYRYLSELEGAR